MIIVAKLENTCKQTRKPYIHAPPKDNLCSNYSSSQNFSPVCAYMYAFLYTFNYNGHPLCIMFYKQLLSLHVIL